MSVLKIERVGQRAYVGGDSYSIRDKLKSAGCHWDGDRRQWWIGAGKAHEVQAVIEGAIESVDVRPGIADDTRIVAKASYKGRNYYVPWFGETKSGERKARLCTLDGKLDFWAGLGDGPEQAKIVKTYQPRTHTFRGHTETRHTTLGSLRSFIEREAENRKAGGAVCAECGKSGELVQDLEDGLMKHRRCCDIEP